MAVDNKYMEMRRKVSHLLYMYDLKMLGRSENNLENEIKI